MDFGMVRLTDGQRRFAEEVRTFLDEIVTPEVHEKERRTGDGFDEGVYLALGRRGWIRPSWPVDEGGAGLGPVERRIIELELARHRVPPITNDTTNLVSVAVEAHASPELLAELRPKIAAGTVRFCLGYSETEGGSDIAAARLRAVRDGEDWVLDGAKIFTTGAQNCQYVFLITRTDFTLPKHKGLTMFLVPLDSPGIEIHPIFTYGEERTNTVFYSGVRVSDRYRLGEVNAGWSVLRGPLDAEHGSGLSNDGLRDITYGRPYTRALERALDATVAWASRTPSRSGGMVIEDPLIVDRLGRISVRLEAATYAPDPMGRVMSAEVFIDGVADLVDIMGAEAMMSHGSDRAPEVAIVEYMHRYAQGTATYGGTVEIFRTLIAEQVLGLPRLELPGRKKLLP